MLAFPTFPLFTLGENITLNLTFPLPCCCYYALLVWLNLLLLSLLYPAVGLIMLITKPFFSAAAVCQFDQPVASWFCWLLGWLLGFKLSHACCGLGFIMFICCCLLGLNYELIYICLLPGTLNCLFVLCLPVVLNCDDILSEICLWTESNHDLQTNRFPPMINL